jgi:hypothetical protein
MIMFSISKLRKIEPKIIALGSYPPILQSILLVENQRDIFGAKKKLLFPFFKIFQISKKMLIFF